MPYLVIAVTMPFAIITTKLFFPFFCLGIISYTHHAIIIVNKTTSSSSSTATQHHHPHRQSLGRGSHQRTQQRTAFHKSFWFWDVRQSNSDERADRWKNRTRQAGRVGVFLKLVLCVPKALGLPIRHPFTGCMCVLCQVNTSNERTPTNLF